MITLPVDDATLNFLPRLR